MLNEDFEEALNQVREEAQKKILTELADELGEDSSVISLDFSNALMACGKSTVDVYGPATIPLEKVMEADRIREQRRLDILKTLVDINVRLKATKNPMWRFMLKRWKKKLVEEATCYEAMPDFTVIEDEIPVTTHWGQTTASRRSLRFMTEDEEDMERAKSGAKVLDIEREKSSRSKSTTVRPVHHSPYTSAREKEAREETNRLKEEEQRRQEEAEKEQQFRRRQIDRYLGDLKAIDMENSTVEEIEQFLEDLRPRDKEEEILASNLRKLLERVKDERGL